MRTAASDWLCSLEMVWCISVRSIHSACTVGRGLNFVLQAVNLLAIHIVQRLHHLCFDLRYGHPDA